MQTSDIIHITPKDIMLAPNKELRPRFMALAHLALSSEKYREHVKFLASQGTYVILDNSVIELGESLDFEQLLEVAQDLNVDEIILPDAYKDIDRTLVLVDKALKYLRDQDAMGMFKLMAVCQGATVRDVVRCFELLNASPSIDVIGMPKMLATIHPAGRAYFERLWLHSDKDIHLLGLWYSWNELNEYEVLSQVRSMDTVLAWWQYSNGLTPKAIRPDGFTAALSAKPGSRKNAKDFEAFVNQSLLCELTGGTYERRH